MLVVIYACDIYFSEVPEDDNWQPSTAEFLHGEIIFEFS
jgi:hypothetical protein